MSGGCLFQKKDHVSISALLEKMDIDKRSYQIGKTKVSNRVAIACC